MDRYSVLIVDDDTVFLDMLGNSFRNEGFQVITASGGREALDLLQVEKPHFLILDLLIPDMSGEDLLVTLQKNPPAPDLVILIVSGSGDLDAKLRCLSAGAHEFVVKPVDVREVVARVRRFMKMIDEFRSFPAQVSPPAQNRLLVQMGQRDQDRSHGTVDLPMSTGDSFARIRPSYGVYRVENLVGSGGMGYVFKGYEEPLDRFVAVKILSRKLSQSPEFVQRFRHEAKVLASMNHPGIAFIYSFGEEEGEHYFAMQWLPGGSLSDLVRRKGRLDVLPALDILLQCAQALFAASRKGIVHRDIKPTNLLFDENQLVKIVDFGLASGEKTSARITQTHEFLGTPSFMAPEQAQSSRVDHRADIYALGITFYYMLYGKNPYESASAIEMIIKHATEPLPEFDSLGGRIPRSAYDIITRMTRKIPEERYPDYPSLIADLESLRNELLRQSKWKIPQAASPGAAAPLRGTNLFELLASVYARSSSGVLTVRWSSLSKQFLIRQRELVLFESTQPDENIWNDLVKRKALRPEDAPPARESLESALNRFLLTQSISIEEFKSAYRLLMKTALLQVFFWPDLNGQFQEAAIEHDAFASIPVGDILLEAARSVLASEALQAVAPDAQVVRTAQFDLVLSSLNLKPEESFVAYRIEDDGTTLNTLTLVTGMPEDRIARILYALECMGAVEFRIPEERRFSPRVPAAPPSPRPEPERPSQIALTPADVAAPAPSAPETPEPKKPELSEMEHNVKVADQFYRMAHEKFTELDYWKVTELCKQAIRHNPRDPRYHHLMAMAFAQHPRFGKDAEQCFYKAIEADPWNADYHVDLARLYIQQGLPMRAAAQCEKALKITPEHSGARDLLSDLERR